MKKHILLALMAMVLGLSFTSCKEDTQPRLKTPDKFVLNTPPMADQMYMLTPTSTIDLTVSQPNYGVACTPVYTVQIAKSEQDFKDGKFLTVEGSTTHARISVLGEYMALAVCKLWDYTTPEDFDDSARPVWVRVHAELANAPQSAINSNAVELKLVKPYFAVPVRDEIYLVGQCEGWVAKPVPEWTLYETEPGSLIYKATFNIPEGGWQFRFYDKFDADEAWEWYSIGPGTNESDDQVNITDKFVDGICTVPCNYDPKIYKEGKGGWEVPDWKGGNVAITVNLNTKTVVFDIN